uniref:Uncharacterized protein n=1 Tax=Solanum tuberosum TaxID=4113 RepID=M1D257_SOLTU
MEIIAPYLHHLEISGSHHVLKCRLVDMSYAVDVKLTFDITCIKDKVENECLPANIGCLWETTCSKCPDQSA